MSSSGWGVLELVRRDLADPKLPGSFSLVGAQHVVGRVGDVFVIPVQQLSRRHCVIRRDDGATVTLEDTSQNGTWVNDARLAKGVPRRLEDGDEICVHKKEGVRVVCYKFLLLRRANKKSSDGGGGNKLTEVMADTVKRQKEELVKERKKTADAKARAEKAEKQKIEAEYRAADCASSLAKAQMALTAGEAAFSALESDMERVEAQLRAMLLSKEEQDKVARDAMKRLVGPPTLLDDDDDDSHKTVSISYALESALTDAEKGRKAMDELTNSYQRLDDAKIAAVVCCEAASRKCDDLTYVLKTFEEEKRSADERIEEHHRAFQAVARDAEAEKTKLRDLQALFTARVKVIEDLSDTIKFTANAYAFSPGERDRERDRDLDGETAPHNDDDDQSLSSPRPRGAPSSQRRDDLPPPPEEDQEDDQVGDDTPLKRTEKDVDFYDVDDDDGDPKRQKVMDDDDDDDDKGMEDMDDDDDDKAPAAMEEEEALHDDDDDDDYAMNARVEEEEEEGEGGGGGKGREGDDDEMQEATQPALEEDEAAEEALATATPHEPNVDEVS